MPTSSKLWDGLGDIPGSEEPVPVPWCFPLQAPVLWRGVRLWSGANRETFSGALEIPAILLAAECWHCKELYTLEQNVCYKKETLLKELRNTLSSSITRHPPGEKLLSFQLGAQHFVLATILVIIFSFSNH